MLSYRHAFHAGNHADVLKHTILVHLLRYLNQKDKPYWFIDTHAGAGRYLLDSEHALKNGEFSGGIGALWVRDDLPPLLADYVAQVRAMNSSGVLRHYPGSPWLAYELMRNDDRLRLFELHSTDIRLLVKTFIKAGPRVDIQQSDGFEAIKAVLPPPPRRGLILIDPAYEDKRDYLRVVAAVKEGYRRFATGSFAVWYPQLQRGDARELPEKLKKIAPKWLDARLTINTPSSDGYGMHGSGMFIVNPPWTLAADLTDTLPYLVKVLGQDVGARFELNTAGNDPSLGR